MFGFILIAVALIVAYKLAIRHQDAQEWAKFEKARKDAAWKTDANPLFKSSVSEHANPLFNTTKEPPQPSENL